MTCQPARGLLFSGMKTVDWLRKEYIRFFAGEQEHHHLPSASLIPAQDPTLLFTTAGMVPFKANYASGANPEFRRAVTIQKCLRTSDLETVGTTDRHCTFFEMLGNFSFGDYFKKEVISMAWEFSTRVLELDPEKIWVTVFEKDDEAWDYWNQVIGVPANRIVRLGAEHNFWGPAGATGPCGPCSELYLDRGPGFPCDSEVCQPGCDCDRFIEYWNLVFVQYHQDSSGQRVPLENPGIDTGAGLERVTCLLQGKESVFDTDELQQMIAFVEEKTGKRYQENKMPFRVIADHSRAAVFAMTDGALPANEGRGYVIRRIIRRAVLYCRKLGLREPFLHTMVPLISRIYGETYPDIRAREENIREVLLAEEKRFLRTLDEGLRRLEKLIAQTRDAREKRIPGEKIFQLYDTYGFPVEITRELAAEEHLELDEAGFADSMARQRERAQADWRNKGAGILKELDEISQNLAVQATTEFLGYEENEANARLLFAREVEGEDDERLAVLVFDRSPFYPEGGGPLGDRGRISLAEDNGVSWDVFDTQKKNEIIFHFVKSDGSFRNGKYNGEVFHLAVDPDFRGAVSRNHSATHLLNAALRAQFGESITQTGSLVADTHLRFDFSHGKALTTEELTRVEDWVNQAISAGGPVSTEVLPIGEARERGAVANFEEKYGDKVRVVAILEGEQPEARNAPALSFELCGGVHVKHPSQIEKFLITRETSPGAGNRRIEAVTGGGADQFIHRRNQELEAELRSVAGELETLLAEQDLLAGDGENQESENGNQPPRLNEELPFAGEIEDIWKQSHQDLPELLRQNKWKPGEFAAVRQAWEETRELTRVARSALQGLRKKITDYSSRRQAASLEPRLEKLGGQPGAPALFVEKMVGADTRELKNLGDGLRQKYPHTGLVFLNHRLDETDKKGNPVPDRMEVLVMASPGLVSAGMDAGKMIRRLLESKSLSGRGGGKPDVAQGGAPVEREQGEAVLTIVRKLAAEIFEEQTGARTG